MKDIRFNGLLSYEIGAPSYVSVVRHQNHVFKFENGKPAFSFIFVQHGALEYHFKEKNKTIVIEKDDVLFVPKDYPYSTKYLKENTKIQILNFDVKTEPLAAELSKPLHYQKNAELSAVFSTITFENMASPFFLCAKIYELLYHISLQAVTIPKKYRKLAPAISELNQQYFKNEKISYYAKLCNMSESNFRKLFREYTGKSPIEYRNTVRIAAAKRLIKTGELTVSEAAYLVGFNNMSFFYEAYNKY